MLPRGQSAAGACAGQRRTGYRIECEPYIINGEPEEGVPDRWSKSHAVAPAARGGFFFLDQPQGVGDRLPAVLGRDFLDRDQQGRSPSGDGLAFRGRPRRAGSAAWVVMSSFIAFMGVVLQRSRGPRRRAGT